MYYIGICDDDKAFIEYIKRILLEKCKDIVFYEYLSGEELVSDMDKREKYDLLIMDVFMPGIDGNEAARNFRSKFPNTLLVFCSGVCMPTDESFKTTPYRYWFKSYSDEQMSNEIDDVINKMKKSIVAPYIMGRKENETVRISPEKILYIELCRNGSLIHYGELAEIYASSKKLSELYELFKDFGFVYAHNSYIVNLRHVSKAHVNHLILSNGQELSVSRSRTQEFRRAFALELSKKYGDESL